MSKKRYRSIEIIGKLPEGDVLLSRGKKIVGVIKEIHGDGGGVEPSQPCGYGILSRIEKGQKP